MTESQDHLKIRKFTRAVIIVSSGLSIVVLAGFGYLASQTKRQVAQLYIDKASEDASSEFIAMNRSIEASLAMVREWGGTGLIRLTDEPELGRLLLPVFTREHLLNGISIADVNGGSFFMAPQEDRVRTRLIPAGKKTETTTWWTRDFQKLESSTTNAIYDPRTRPWFSPSFETEGIHWTAPYVFFTSKLAGITASASFHNTASDLKTVVAFDIKLGGLYRAVYALAPSPHSQVFIFKGDGNLYIPNDEDQGSVFLSMTDVKDTLVKKTYDRWAGGKRQPGQLIRLTHAEERWWCGFNPLAASRQSSWLCVMVPEGDIQQEARTLAGRFWLFGFIALIPVWVSGLWRVRSFSRNAGTGDSFDAAHPEESVRSLLKGGENRYVEFKSTMRMNLHSKKPGKEIELAWLKGVCAFLNTEGGVLLLGVTDDGEITGLERDVFENEDKCNLHFKNLIGRHIGAEMSKYINFTQLPMEGKTVGVVRCTRSGEPAFLKDGDKEAFYIRNGPASDELPVSKVLAYIKKRK